jgi:F0F1-type ATP synthase assembly protein I
MPGPPTNNDAWGGLSVGYSIVSYILGGLLVGWGMGAGLDHLLHTAKVFTAIFMLVGVGLGVYLVYLHYGKPYDDRV